MARPALNYQPLRFNRSLLALLGLVFMLSSAQAQIPGMETKSDWQVGGYVKYMLTSSKPDGQSHFEDHLLHQRLNIRYQATSALDFHLGMRNRLFSGEQSQAPDFADRLSEDLGYWDLNKSGSYGSNKVLSSNIDRAYLQWRVKDWHIKAGRFRVNWSMNSIWNPNDIFNSYCLYDFDYEERSGRDGINLTYQLGFASELNFTYSLREQNTTTGKSQAQDYGIRYLNHTKGWDWQLIAGKSLQDNILAAGFAGQVYGAGVKGEISWFDPEHQTAQQELWGGILTNMPSSISQANSILNSESKASYVASLEADYSIKSERNWFISLASLYTSSPTNTSTSQNPLNAPQSARELSFTTWTHYASISLDINSLNRLVLVGIYYQDGSYFTSASLNTSLADNWQLLSQLQHFDGKPDSQFGRQALSQLFLQLRWSF